MFVGCVFSWYYLKCTFFRTSINRNWLLFMEFDTLSRLNDILQIPFFFLFLFYCCRSFFYGFVFFSLFDRFLYAQLFIHRVHIPYAFMAFVHILIRRWRKKTHSHEYGLEYPIKWRLYHVLMSFRGRLTKGVNNSIHKNSFQVK